jgi:aldose 1-epimerase
MKLLILIALLPAIAMAFGGSARPQPSGTRKQEFGKLADGRQASLYILSNKNGMEAAITNYGATLVSLKVPDRQGKLADVVLGYDNLEGYVSDKSYLGVTVGRYANRIGHARFTLDGKTYQLAKNDSDNTLHGGAVGFNKQLWDAKEVPGEQAVRFHYLSKDGEENFPGNLSVQVTYALTDANELKIDYAATTDKDTVLNLTNHAYYNLKGQGQGDILQHQLTLHADRFTPVDAGLIPTGELRAVQGTPFDFTAAHTIGERINHNDEQLKLGRGYDHNFVLNGKMGTLRPAAQVYEPTTGRMMDILTTEPGIQLYSGNFLDGTIHGKAGKVYNHRYAFCLETQHFPDSPNQPQFPTTELKPGQRFHSTTVMKFSAK